MKTASPNELSPAERAAFETLVRLVGFTPQVRFGRATEHLALSVEGRVLYAIYPVQNGGQVLRRGAREYRLLIVPAGGATLAELAREAGVSKQAIHQRLQRAARKGPKGAPARATLRKGSPELRALMSEIGRKNWRARVKKYGPTGIKPGVTPPWEHPNNVAFQKHAAKVAREQAVEPPAKPLKTF